MATVRPHRNKAIAFATWARRNGVTRIAHSVFRVDDLGAVPDDLLEGAAIEGAPEPEPKQKRSRKPKEPAFVEEPLVAEVEASAAEDEQYQPTEEVIEPHGDLSETR